MADTIRAITEAVDKLGLQAFLTVAIVIAAGFMAWALWRMANAMQSLIGGALKENTDSNHHAADQMGKLAESVDGLASRQDDICKANQCQAEMLARAIRGHT